MDLRTSKYDVIIIGAGISGLICSTILLSKGLKVLTLEARSRAGGRIYTLSHLSESVELGAEFVHGADAELLSLFEKAGISFFDLEEKHFYLNNKKLVEKKEYWEEIEKVSARLNPKIKADRSLKDFLESQGKKIKPHIRSLLVAYYEGFHAANLELIGERGLAEIEQHKDNNLNGNELFRPEQGYGQLIEFLLKSHGDPERWLRYESVVKKIEWEKDEVTVYGPAFSSEKAKRVVITVPIGVLKSENPQSSISFDPIPKGLEDALTGIHMGQVERITLEFKSRFWEGLTKKPISFMHGNSEDYFPTWWTQWPRRAPFLTAWQGGKRALELARMDHNTQVNIALRTLSKLTGKSKKYLNSQLKGFHLHNWGSDPFAGGAYSYLGIDGSKKSARLRRPFDNTLFFAGEATAEIHHQATVHGAIRSGQRVARQILNSLL